ncbi:MAG: Asp-tRNA(Asn)/Glu-tRNA(Gln) amidotransferase GatCAB subunit B [Anaerolineae bacterium]|nr:Asp-tRNA(Asn)/Glu-tRNA(Gln) amidotransferase subunit GatB [Anaerolineales bacterium]MCQ3980132.1 Asp-tRNA(Asn)/Glu-tRNA(Gln) amidotransferase GatCAB subunit B [Anaerolineae bacterium]
MTYQPIIGMEVHVELNTHSKMFCGCNADFFGVPPNTRVCPVCLGMPGALPVINQRAIEYTLMIGLALNCEIQPHNVFARKNYFYPDLPKGYQISQYELPLCLGGYVDIETGDGQPKRIRIRRVHLEEDTGKLVHVNNYSLVDLNRAGVPLVEIVTEADIHSAEEAYAYVSKLRQLVRYLGVSSGDMEKGAMRCEVNLSLMDMATGKWGTKVEIKNLNSFRSVRNSIAYEIERQAKVLSGGGVIEQVTMGWDENRSITVLQRAKEGDTGYRYFPEPDLPPLDLDPAWIEQVSISLPELPDPKLARYVSDYGLSQKEAKILSEDRAIAAYYESVVAATGDKTTVTPKLISNWVSGELFRLLGERGVEIGEVKIKPEDLVALIELVNSNAINQPAAKQTLGVMFDTGRPPLAIIEELGLRQISDAGELTAVAQQVIADNPDPVAQFRAGKEATLKFLVGQVMKATRGKANPQLAEQALREQLQQ